ncbi:MAG: magnesium transporter [Firmicutes bacterium]|jgi:magnesium transporter|nr:magnesium transporter [Bacillota bacterium]
MKDILELIDNNQLNQARNLIIGQNPVDIAHFLEEVPLEKILIIFRILPKDLAADVFAYLSSEQKKYIVENITEKEIRSILDELFLDDTVDFLEEMPANFVKKVLRSADEKTRKLLNQFLSYPENSAGSVMTIEYVDLKKEMTVQEALAHIRKTGVDKETINTCYVLAEDRRLEGIVSIRKLILSDAEVKLQEIMETNIIYAHTLEDQEDVADRFRKYDLLAMPVVDNENRLVGIITIDDVLDIVEEENTEDFQRMAGMEPSEKEYLKTPLWSLAKHRVIWLLVLMISATFTATIIQRFEDLLQAVVLLAAFIPLIMDSGGNAGSQSSTLVIRGLALGEISTGDLFRVLKKELAVGIIVGGVLAATNMLRLFYLQKVGFLISSAVSISLFLTVLFANLVGGALPLIAKFFRVDPAIMASPLITTIVDAVALGIYFLIVTRLLAI